MLNDFPLNKFVTISFFFVKIISIILNNPIKTLVKIPFLHQNAKKSTFLLPKNFIMPKNFFNTPQKKSSFLIFLLISISTQINQTKKFQKNTMNPQFLPDFLEYLKSSTHNLHDSLHGVFEHEPLPYDVVYEKFLKIIENFKIKTLTQLKLQLYPSTPNDEQQKDYILLSQMKTLISSKIKMYLFGFLKINLIFSPGQSKN